MTFRDRLLTRKSQQTYTHDKSTSVARRILASSCGHFNAMVAMVGPPT